MKIRAMRCLVCVLYYNKIVCKDDVFLAFKATIVKVFVPGCTGQLHQMGLIVVTIKHWLFVFQQPILIGWD